MDFNDTKKSDIASSTITTQSLAIAASGLVQGGDVECRWAKVIAEAAKTVYIGGNASVDNTCPLLSNTVWQEFQIDNTQALHFAGTEGDKVYIISGS
jgi:hypothetical protein